MSLPPSKAERQKCWTARDDYWKCMDNNNGNADACKTLRKSLELYCSKQWVKIKLIIVH